MLLATRERMRSPEAFVLNLRRLRLQRGISVDELAARTNVSVDLWKAMERNDFSRWPTGVAARAYIRDYATIVGLNRDETVDEFCRVNLHGDRRGYRLLRETAEALGHQLVWRDDPPPDVTEGDRRASSPANDKGHHGAWWYANRRRLVAGVDLIVVVVLASGIAGAIGLRWWWATLAVSALLYHSLSLAFLGSSPTVWAIDAYLAARRPSDRRSVISVFPGLDLMVDKHPTRDHRATD
jgi:transcriptional regulator with XRE-family HTH domain